jgi:hypothetical protein
MTMKTETHATSTRLAFVLRRLDGAFQINEHQYEACCPAHEDEHSSLHVAVGEDEKILLDCKAGCGLSAILNKIRVHERDLFVNDGRRVAALYDYEDERGELLRQVVRYAPKNFTQRWRTTDGEWVMGKGAMAGVPSTLYKLPDLHRAGGRVYWVEGEKDADRLWDLGLTATTVPQGADAPWRPEYADQLRWTGVSEVILVPDNDEPGVRHAERFASALVAAGVQTKVLTLSEGKDVTDWIAMGHGIDELQGHADAAPYWTRTKETDASTYVSAGAGPRGSDSDQTLRSDTGIEAGSSPVLIRLSDVDPRPVSWLWQGRIPLGKLTLLVGDPDVGKSFVTLDLAARVTRGSAFPDGSPAPAGGVVLLSAEDAPDDTVRPRLDALGGDPSRVVMLRAMRERRGDRPFSLERDLPVLRSIVAEMGALLVVVDPLSSYMGKLNSWRDTDVRGVLDPLTTFAQDARAAIVGIMHLTKDDQKRAITRGLGSMAFVAAARASFVIGREAGTSRRLMATNKLNLGPHPPGLAFTFSEDGRIVWEPRPIPGLTADDVLKGSRGDVDDVPGALQEAVAWLRHFLSAGPRLAKDVSEEATKVQITVGSLKRAKSTLRVVSEKLKEVHGGWLWRLPQSGEVTSGRVVA